MKKATRGLLILFVIIVFACLGINTWLSLSAQNTIYTNTISLPYNTYALVLGTTKYAEDGKEFRTYYNRIASAATLYKSGKVKYLLVSSSNNSAYSFNANTMKKDLVALGVPDAHIIVDPFGLRTLDSITRCKNKFGINNITIISQEQHCERALCLARYKGLNAVAYAAPSGSMAATAGTLYHEQVARFVMLYDLLSNRTPATMN